MASWRVRAPLAGLTVSGAFGPFWTAANGSLRTVGQPLTRRFVERKEWLMGRWPLSRAHVKSGSKSFPPVERRV
ncbi:hypothetical protein AAHA92_16285 [Salvia divinorum]|uniref:Secreted protein n=1 Tax=Salvia divinorum TaxID=28513 RepID=A0ABD1GYY9_SALDI